MSFLTALLGFAAGVWAEASFDLSGRALQAWRWWQSFRKGL